MKSTVTELRLENNKLLYINGVCLGEVLPDVDGYYKFWPDTTRGGYWNEYILTRIAKFLKDKNRSWDRQVKRDLGRLSGGRISK